MSKGNEVRQKRSTIVMAGEWLLVSAGLPIAIPVLVAIFLFVIARADDPLRHFLDQGDFLLATVVLAGALIYDISDAFNTGRIRSNGYAICRIILWVLASIVLVYYVVLRSAIQLAPLIEPRISTAYVGLAAYGSTCLFALGVRCSLLSSEARE